MPKLHFREATPADAALVARIIRRAFAGQDKLLGLNRQDHAMYATFETAAHIRQRMQEGMTIVLAYEGDQPVGTVSYTVSIQWFPGQGWIERLAVLPEYRGRQYGEQLMAHAEKRLIKLGVPSIVLAIVKPFARLQAFYERLGYRPQKTITVPGWPYEILIMDKSVSP